MWFQISTNDEGESIRGWLLTNTAAAASYHQMHTLTYQNKALE